MDATFPFLQLPGEIREQIYIAYFSTPDNTYTFDFPSKKLRKSDNTPIDVSLVATCKAVAHETRGMAFHLNTIKFNTLYSDELRILACRFNLFFHERANAVKDSFCRRAAFLDPAKLRDIVDRHPVILRAIEQYKTNGFGMESELWPDVPSRGYFASLDAQRAYLSALPHDAPFPDAGSERGRKDRQCIEKLVAFEINPWDIPLDYNLDDIYKDAAWIGNAKNHLSRGRHPNSYDHCRSVDNGKYRFSAAATAIFFLRRIIPETRCLIQNILIDEDYQSVASPACHALGLIPFCQENPSLRIIRRLSLWGNLFVSESGFLRWQDDIHWFFRTRMIGPRPPADSLHIGSAAINVADWMAETGILTSMGMPVGQFALFMDGDPKLEKTSEIFQEFYKAALRQEVCSKAPDPELLLPLRSSVYSEKSMDHFILDDFPRLLTELSNNWESGIIQCNFDPGTPIGSADEILATHPDWGWEKWEYEMFDYFEEWADPVVPGIDQMALHSNMIESYCQKYPNGPPRDSWCEFPDWE